MWTRALLKENGKVAFRRNYGSCLAVTLLAGLMGAGTSGAITYNLNMEELEGGVEPEVIDSFLHSISPVYIMMFLMILLVSLVIGICAALLLTNVVIVGKNRYFLENREHKTDIMQLFYGFKNGRYSTNVWIMFMRDVYIFAWSLLFWIPGIIKGYSYMLVPYILAENTQLDRRRVFELSQEMMRGHKWEAFVLNLSFLGWHILSAMTMGLLSMLYVNPYMEATYAEFYSAIKAEAKAKGIVHEGELPGVYSISSNL